MLDILITLCFTFSACFAFCFIFDFHSLKQMAVAAMGGVLSWCAYLLCAPLENDLLAYFIATIVISVYSEIMARIFKSPVTGFLLISLLPLVPGGGIYYTMEYCVRGDTAAFLESGLHTFGIAGALAIGVLLVSSFVRLWQMIRLEYKLPSLKK